MCRNYSSNLRWSLTNLLWTCVWKSSPISISKTRYCCKWPVDQVWCLMSRFWTDIRAVAVCNQLHTQSGFNYTCGKDSGLKWIWFQGFLSGRFGSTSHITNLSSSRSKNFGLSYFDVSLLIAHFKNTLFLLAVVKLGLEMVSEVWRVFAEDWGI